MGLTKSLSWHRWTRLLLSAPLSSKSSPFKPGMTSPLRTSLHPAGIGLRRFKSAALRVLISTTRRKPTCVLNHDAKAKNYWDLLILMLGTYCLLFAPVDAAFADEYL